MLKKRERTERRCVNVLLNWVTGLGWALASCHQHLGKQWNSCRCYELLLSDLTFICRGIGVFTCEPVYVWDEIQLTMTCADKEWVGGPH